MILINKHTKLSSHISSMSINDILLIKQIMLIGFSSAKYSCFRVLMWYIFQTITSLFQISKQMRLAWHLQNVYRSVD